MDDQNVFLVGMTDDQIAQISAATNLPPEVVSDGLAFENRWSAKGLPGGEEAMQARTLLVQAVGVLVYGMNVPPQLLADYVLDAIAEMKIMAEKHGPPAEAAAEAAAAPGQPQAPVEGEDDEDGEDDGEGDDEDDAEVEGGGGPP